MFEFPIDRVDGEYGILADKGMPVFEAGPTRRYEGFKKLSIFGNFLEESEGSATDIFIRMLLRRDGQ